MTNPPSITSRTKWREGEIRPGPLSKLKVLDFTTNVSGPYGTRVLVDLGADVIKIERLEGDDARLMSPIKDGVSAAFVTLNRGKRSLALDLKDEHDRAIARDLAAQCDVLVENMRPGVMERLGIGFDDVRATNSTVIYCSISGFGQDGPLSDRVAYDMVIQGRTGIMSITGEEDRPPIRVGPSIVDISTGMWAACAISAALWKRNELGRAQWLDLSLFEAGLAWMTLPVAAYEVSGQVPKRLGSQTPLSAPADVYPTENSYVVMAVLSDTLWNRLTELPQFQHLAGVPEFKSNSNRVESRDRLTQELRRVFLTASTEEWVEVLTNKEVPCSQLCSVDEIMSDEQAIARGTYEEIGYSGSELLMRSVFTPLANSQYPQLLGRRRMAPTIGEHNAVILSQEQL